jgi:hypothetical protein
MCKLLYVKVLCVIKEIISGSSIKLTSAATEIMSNIRGPQKIFAELSNKYYLRIFFLKYVFTIQ